MSTTIKIGAVLMAFVVLFAVMVGAAAVLVLPAGYLSIDVNPSMELTYNRLNRVVEARALNPEAQELLGDQRLFGKEVDDVVEIIVGSLISEGYLSSADARLLLSTDDSARSRRLLERINNQVVFSLMENNGQAEVLSQVVDLNDDDLEEAHGLNMSAGRYALLQAIQVSDDDLEDMDLSGFTLGELIRYAEENDLDLSDLFDDWDDDRNDDRDDDGEHNGDDINDDVADNLNDDDDMDDNGDDINDDAADDLDNDDDMDDAADDDAAAADDMDDDDDDINDAADDLNDDDDMDVNDDDDMDDNDDDINDAADDLNDDDDMDVNDDDDMDDNDDE